MSTSIPSDDFEVEVETSNRIPADGTVQAPEETATAAASPSVATPTAPAESGPDANADAPDPKWAHHDLYTAVYNAIYALPAYFRAELNIVGIPVADLQAFNTSLGATIESQTVETLNSIRAIWDKSGQYANYTFVRQSQQFPDVILKATAPTVEPRILMGIELKGWYIMSREGEPSFRYTVTPAVCAPCDLLVVVPWALCNVISGTPHLFKPYVVSARYAANLRNWHWQYKRETSANSEVITSTINRYYPSKADPISDVARYDQGGNFGRYARSGLMDEYMREIYSDLLYGISLGSWQRFFALFSESSTAEETIRKLNRLADDLAKSQRPVSVEAAVEIAQALSRLVTALATPTTIPASRPRKARTRPPSGHSESSQPQPDDPTA